MLHVLKNGDQNDNSSMVNLLFTSQTYMKLSSLFLIYSEHSFLS